MSPDAAVATPDAAFAPPNVGGFSAAALSLTDRAPWSSKRGSRRPEPAADPSPPPGWVWAEGREGEEEAPGALLLEVNGWRCDGAAGPGGGWLYGRGWGASAWSPRPCTGFGEQSWVRRRAWTYTP